MRRPSMTRSNKRQQKSSITRWQEEYDESVKSSDTCSGKRDTNEVGSAEGGSYHRGEKCLVDYAIEAAEEPAPVRSALWSATKYEIVRESICTRRKVGIK